MRPESHGETEKAFRSTEIIFVIIKNTAKATKKLHFYFFIARLKVPFLSS